MLLLFVCLPASVVVLKRSRQDNHFEKRIPEKETPKSRAPPKAGIPRARVASRATDPNQAELLAPRFYGRDEGPETIKGTRKGGGAHPVDECHASEQALAPLIQLPPFRLVIPLFSEVTEVLRVKSCNWWLPTKLRHFGT